MKRGRGRSSPKRYRRAHHPELDGEDNLSYAGVSVASDGRAGGRRLAANNHRRIESRDLGHALEDLRELTGLGPPSGGRQAQAQLKITNLSPDVEHRRLRDAVFHRFKHYGRIMVVLEGRGTQRECYVDFDFEGDALTAKRAEQGKSLFDYSMQITFMKLTSAGRVSLDPAEQRDDGRVSSLEQPPTRTLFVGNLELDVGDRELRRVFSDYGKVESVDVKRASQGSQATYAFVRFATVDAAVRARERMQGYQLGRNHMRIGYGRGTPTTLLWVSGVGYWVSKAELEHEFDRFGAIRRIDYRPDENYAYIQYDSIDAAIAACNDMRGSRLGGHKLQVDFADAPLIPSQPRERKVTYTPPLLSSRTSQGYKPQRRYEQQRVELDHRDEPRMTGRRPPLEYEDLNDFDLPPYEPVRRDSRTSYDDEGMMYGGRYEEHLVAPRRPAAIEYHRDPIADRMGFRSRRADNGQPPIKRPRLDSNDVRPVHRPVQRPRLEAVKTKRPPPSVSPAMRRASAPGHQRMRHLSVNELKQRKAKNFSNERLASRSRIRSETKSYSKPKEKAKGSIRSRSQSAKEPPRRDRQEKKDKDSKPVEAKRSTRPASSSSKTAESLGDLAKRFAVAWKGQLQLKTAAFSVRMHLIAGDPSLADQLLRGAQGQTIANTSFSVTQRLRLEQTKLEEVNRKVNTAGPSGHCMLLALPGPAPAALKDQKQQDVEPDESDSQTMKHLPVRNFIAYLRGREAAGIVMLSAPPSAGGAATAGKDASGVMYIFPPCIFSQQHLTRVAPSLPAEPSKEDHLLVIVVRGVN